ncbi:MAG: DMT family transporter [Alphaproteobacteria bacterium]|nr:DMT family transporter [Alphaproteobacteria bacterium]
MSLRVWLWLLSLSVLWGGSFFFAKVALSELGPLTVVFARVTLAALALATALAVAGTNPFRRGLPWPAFFAMGALNNVLPFSLIFWGQTEIASGLASILNATTPLFTLIVAHVLTDDEKIDRAKVAALLAGLAGVVVLVGPDALVGGSSLWGQLACLAAALSYAFAGIYGRRFRALGVPPVDAATGQVTASAVLILPIMLVIEHPWTLAVAPSATVWLALVGLALLSTALGYVLYFRILAAAGATILLLVTFLIPITAIVLGALVLHEQLLARHFAGMALIGFGLALIDGRLPRLLRPAK